MAVDLLIFVSYLCACYFVHGSEDADYVQDDYDDSQFYFTDPNKNSTCQCLTNPWHEIVASKRLESFGVEDWQKHKAVIPSLPTEYIRRVNLSGPILSILGKYKLNEDLLQKFAELIETENPEVLQKEGEIEKLGNIFCGFSTLHMSKIQNKVIGSLWNCDFFRSMKGCSTAKLRILLEKLKNIGMIGPSKTWDPDTVSRLGALVSGLPSKDFKRIRVKSMSGISPEVIALTSPETLKALYMDQLRSLSRQSLLQWRRSTKDSRPLCSTSTLLFYNTKLQTLLLSSIMSNAFVQI